MEGGHFLHKVLDKTFKTNFLFDASCVSVRHKDGNVSINLKDTLGVRKHECDFLLNATGIQNDNELPRKAGIKIGKFAVVVSPFMQTNFPDIYAAGDAVDIGSFSGSKFGIIPTAIDQAKIAAINMLGSEVPYTGTLPWTTLKVAGINLTSLGEVTTGLGIQEECVEIDSDTGVYQKLFFKDNTLRGAILIGTKQNLHTLKTLTIQKASLKEVKEKFKH